MTEEYDIFISYRRYVQSDEDKHQEENISKVGRLNEALLRKGYKVFFDQNNRSAEALKERIFPAVRNSRCFVLFLTEGCFDGCNNNGEDWLREEIEEALKAGKKIVPVTLDDAVKQWPDNLPNSLKILSDKSINIMNIHNDTSYQSDVDNLFEAIGKPKISKRDISIIYIKPDYDCFIYKKIWLKKNVILTRALKNNNNILYLKRGMTHKLVFEAEGCPQVISHESIETSGSHKSIPIYLADKVEEELVKQKEREQKKSVLPIEVDGVVFNMVKVDGDTFWMGEKKKGDNKINNWNPPTKVILNDFYIGETVVTQELWKGVMGNNPSRFKGDDNLPVEQVSWDDACEFIKKLNDKTRRKFRLPTEAEWEFAARGGKKSKGFTYSGSDIIDEVAWFEGDHGDKTHPVKRKKANELGLYDMSGNVWEWCNDWYGKYNSGLQYCPTGAENGTEKVNRGGCFSDKKGCCCVSCRDSNSKKYIFYGLGFRLAMDCDY